MTLRINDTTPDFTARTTHGEIRFHEWIGYAWCILFSHPKDFTPVCTTELGHLAGMKSKFIERECKLIGLSVDSLDTHIKWREEIFLTQGHEMTIPLIADEDLRIAKLYNMLPAGGGAADRTAVDNLTVRTVYIIAPDKKIKLMMAYPMSTGRDFDEILRALDSLQLTTRYQVATPANWTRGDDVIIAPSVSNDEAKSLFPNGWRTETEYLRYIDQPVEVQV